MKYQEAYNKLIECAKSREIIGYCEKHHIIPRCIGGTDDPENIVKLTAEEHWLAHRLLVRIYPEHPYLIFALVRMSKDGKVKRNKMYGWLRNRVAEEISKLHKDKPKSEQHKKKIGNANRGRKQTPEHIAKRAEALRNTTYKQRPFKTPEEVDLYWKKYWLDLQKAKDSAIITALLYSL